MEVDETPPLSGSQPDIASPVLPPLTTLKRSNSAPMINLLGTGVSVSTSLSTTTPAISVSRRTPISAQLQTLPSTSAHSFNSQNNQASFSMNSAFHKQYERTRRYSMSSTNLHSSSTPVKVAPQLDRIKREESSNPKEREAAHEHKVQSHMQLSLSWESLNLADNVEPRPSLQNNSGADTRRPKSFQEPLHIFTTPYPFASSPSPTRLGKQCFSPSLQQPVRTLAGGSLTPSPNPSPTRKSFARRSMSPIALRPSPLGASLKRKMDSDSMDCYSSPKRPHYNNSPGITSDRNPFSHPLMQSMPSSDEGCPVSLQHQHHNNGMLPPTHNMHVMADTTTSSFLAASTNTTTTSSMLFHRRSPLVFSSSSSSSPSSSRVSASTVVRASSTNGDNNGDNTDSNMDTNDTESGTGTDRSQQEQQRNVAFRNAMHGQFPNIPGSHGDFQPRVQLQQQQQQQHQNHHQHQQLNQLLQPHHNNNNTSSHHNHHLQQQINRSSSSSSSPPLHNLSTTPTLLRGAGDDISPLRVSGMSANSSPGSMYSTFRPVVRDSIESAMTDSETSDMADISETSDANNSIASLDAGNGTTSSPHTSAVFNVPTTSPANSSSAMKTNGQS